MFSDIPSPLDLTRAYAAWLAAMTLCMALATDLVAGEPPSHRHPVAWLGRLLDRLAPWVHAGGRAAGAAADEDSVAFRRGAIAWCAVALGVIVLAIAVQSLLMALPTVFAAAALGLVLKPMFAWRMLHDQVQAVEAGLAQSLEEGRAQLRHLASRDSDVLDAEGVRETAIESLAENLNDSVVAPIFWFLLLGLPGAALYRFANTADAMWGYRGVAPNTSALRAAATSTLGRPGGAYAGRDWRHAGTWAARADDVLSWIPARITALLLLIVGGGISPLRLWREARRTPSPNGGWPMAAMALLLGVRLRKPGTYTLHAEGRAVRAEDTRRALSLATRALWLGLLPPLLALLALSVS